MAIFNDFFTRDTHLVQILRCIIIWIGVWPASSIFNIGLVATPIVPCTTRIVTSRTLLFFESVWLFELVFYIRLPCYPSFNHFRGWRGRSGLERNDVVEHGIGNEAARIYFDVPENIQRVTIFCIQRHLRQWTSQLNDGKVKEDMSGIRIRTLVLANSFLPLFITNSIETVKQMDAPDKDQMIWCICDDFDESFRSDNVLE